MIILLYLDSNLSYFTRSSFLVLQSDNIHLSLTNLSIFTQGEPGFQGPIGPRGPPGDGLPGEKVQTAFHD